MPADSPTLSSVELDRTADHIVDQQQPDGLILWFPGGHADTWNHTEAAMALSAAGRVDEAASAYRWLATNQRPDGSWHHYYLADGIEDAKVDTNCCAYVATGVWHHWLVTGDTAFAVTMWPVVEAALDFVTDLATMDGHIPWAVHRDGTPWSYALLTGSSSIFHSLRCGLALADHLGHDKPEWELAAVRVATLVADREDSFEPKRRWAMDWYYPVLSGAVTAAAATARLEAGAPTFLLEDHGVRCVSDQPWVTAAETCECAMAYLVAGQVDRARALFDTTRALRDEHGAYFTGMVMPDRVTFPDGERSSYTSAAVILAADALDRFSPAGGLLVGDHIPPLSLD